MRHIVPLGHELTAALSDCAPFLMTSNQVLNGFGQPFRAALGHKPVVAFGWDAFRKRAVPGRDHRQATRLRFLQRQPLAFLVAFDSYAGQNEEVRSGIKWLQRAGLAMEKNAIPQTQVVRKRFEFFPQWTITDDVITKSAVP
jgi:hypothetical protein